jgi:agmatinase
VIGFGDAMGGDASNLFGNHFELVYADIATFGKAPPAQYVGIENADVAVYGIPWDATATLRPGARLGPRGIREQSLYFREVWDPQGRPFIGHGPPRGRLRDRIKMVDCGDVTVWPGDVMRTGESIRRAAAAVARHAFPIMLGGDHYVMFPAYQGVCDAKPGKRVGIIQIDAHSDLIDSDPYFGKHWSGTPIRRAIEHSDLDPKATANIGLRGFIGRDVYEYERENGVTIITMVELREMGLREAIDRAMQSILRHCDVVYATVDIDSVDPSCAPGCSTPVPGGLTSDEFLKILRLLGQRREIVALDLVEIAPPLDPTSITTILAAHALFGFIEEHFLLAPEASS